MNSVRYVGLDVHRDTISVAVLNEGGRLIQQSVLATRPTQRAKPPVELRSVLDTKSLG